MAVADKVGHDSRGLTIPRNDLVDICTHYRTFKETGAIESPTHLGFVVEPHDLEDQLSLVCRRYDPRIAQRLSEMEAEGCTPVTMGELVDNGVISVQTVNNGVRKDQYLPDDDDGGVPFIRTSNIANFEIIAPSAKRIPWDVFESLPSKAKDFRPGDILFIKDGDKLVGSCAIVDKADLPFVLQSHLFRIRVHDRERINPFLLLHLLSADVTRLQIRARIVIQSTLGTIGKRWRDVVLMCPDDPNQRDPITDRVRSAVRRRRRLLSVINGPSAAPEIRRAADATYRYEDH